VATGRRLIAEILIQADGTQQQGPDADQGEHDPQRGDGGLALVTAHQLPVPRQDGRPSSLG